MVGKYGNSSDLRPGICHHSNFTRSPDAVCQLDADQVSVQTITQLKNPIVLSFVASFFLSLVANFVASFVEIFQNKRISQQD